MGRSREREREREGPPDREALAKLADEYRLDYELVGPDNLVIVFRQK